MFWFCWLQRVYAGVLCWNLVSRPHRTILALLLNLFPAHPDPRHHIPEGIKTPAIGARVSCHRAPMHFSIEQPQNKKETKNNLSFCPCGVRW